MNTLTFCPNCFADGFAEHCPHCGYAAVSQADNHMLLPPGMKLQNRYLLGRVLGAGGFGITYLVQDAQGGRLCAVKEYLPSMLAVRDSATKSVRPSSTDNAETFRHGLDVFRREAQMLQKFSGNPAVVDVYDYFEQNGTAYFVMEYLDGVNLKTLMRSMGGRVPLDLATDVLRSIAAVLAQVHGQGLLHRDVSPENIFLTKAGDTKLIDFGATRFFVGERSRSLSVILKPGFAPPEQYSSHGNQGPWTDLYALCASFYNVAGGQALPDAPDRLAGAQLVPLSAAVPGISPALAAAVERGLELDYRKRQQSMEEFLRDIGAAPGPPAHSAAPRLAGSPYIQSLRDGRPGDKWLIPKNMPMSIGRASDKCNIVVDAPNVSRVHCTVQYDDKAGVFSLTDLSSNGTLAKGARLQPGVACKLEAGETFYITGPDLAMKVGLE